MQAVTASAGDSDNAASKASKRFSVSDLANYGRNTLEVVQRRQMKKKLRRESSADETDVAKLLEVEEGTMPRECVV